MASAERVRVAVPAAESGDAFVAYTVSVKRGASSWAVSRRYQAFEALAVAIKRVLPADAMPELPRKQLRLGASKFAPEFVETRRKGLEAFLQQLVAAVEPERVEALDDFLEYTEHCLAEAMSRLACVTELTHVTRMLRTAMERYRITCTAQGSSSTGAGKGSGRAWGGAKARRGSVQHDDEADDDDELASAAAPASSAGGSGGGPLQPMSSGELLGVLKEGVRMLSEYAGILRGALEDTTERGAATGSSNVHLASRLRVKHEEGADTLQLLVALRERRAAECDKERVALALGAVQARTVTAELRRVGHDCAGLGCLAEAHGGESAALRRALVEWERGGALPPQHAAGAAQRLPPSAGGASRRPELAGPTAGLHAASDAATAVHSLVSGALAGAAGAGGSESPAGIPTVALPLEPKPAGGKLGGSGGRAPYVPPPALAAVYAGAARVLTAAAGVGGGGEGGGSSGSGRAGASATPQAAPGCVGSGPSQAVALLLAAVAAENAGLTATLLALRAGAVVPRELPPLVVARGAAAGGDAAEAPSGGASSGASGATGGPLGSLAAQATPHTGALPSGSGGGGRETGASGWGGGSGSSGSGAPAKAANGGAGAAGGPTPAHSGVPAGTTAARGSGLNPHYMAPAAAAPASSGRASLPGSPQQPQAGPPSIFDAGPFRAGGSGAPAASGGLFPAAATSVAPAAASSTSAAAALLRAKLQAAAPAAAPSRGNPFGGGGGGGGGGGNPF